MRERPKPPGRRAFFFLASFILVVSSPLAQEAKPRIKVIKENAAVRISPSTAANVFKTLPLGAIFDLEESAGDWIKITIPSEIGINMEGYVRRGDVELVGTNAPPPSKDKPAVARKDDADKKIIRFKDGSLIKAKILKETPESIEVETEFGRFPIKRGQISEIQSALPGEEEKPQAKPLEPGLKRPGEKQTAETEVRLNTPPKLTKRVPPQYPTAALNRKIEGVVILEVRIDKQGKVKDVKILRSLAALDKAATKAVEQWIYEPVVIDGRPQDAVFTVTVDFKLKSGE
jgi:TonB family protein